MESIYHRICNDVVSFRSNSERVVSKSSDVSQALFFGKEPSEEALDEFRWEISKALESLKSLLNLVDEIASENELLQNKELIELRARIKDLGK